MSFSVGLNVITNVPTITYSLSDSLSAKDGYSCVNGVTCVNRGSNHEYHYVAWVSRVRLTEDSARRLHRSFFFPGDEKLMEVDAQSQPEEANAEAK